MSGVKKIDFVIIGAQKAGTSFMADFLRNSNHIYMPEGETSFFEDMFYDPSNLHDFFKELNKGSNNKIIGIKRPSYLAFPQCAERLKRDLDNPKIIILLRNPVDRAISSYYHNMRYGFLPIISLKKGFNQLIQGNSIKKYPRSSEVLDFGYYGKQLGHYYSVFEKNRILVLLYDDLKKRPIDILKKTLKFLNINYHDIDFSQSNKKVQITEYDLKLLRVLSWKNNFKYIFNKEKTRLFEKKQSNIDKLMLQVIDYIYSFLRKRIKVETKIKEKEEVIELLKEFYKEDVLKLKEIIGKNQLWHW